MQNNFNKITPVNDANEKVDDELIFLKNSLSDSSNNSHKPYNKLGKRKKVDKNLVLDMIRQKAPIHLAELKRELDIGNTTLWNIIREFEFVGLIETREVFNEKLQNHFKIISIPEIKKEVKND